MIKTATLKKPSTIIALIIIIAIAIGAYFQFTKEPVSKYEFTEVSRGSVTQEVSVTGKVKAAESVDLSFEKTGKITFTGFKVGSRVTAGQTLASLESGDISGQLLQAQAGVQAQQAKLDELKRGARPEDIQTAQTAVDNAQKSLDDAKVSLSNTKNSADSNLQSVYDGSLTAAIKSLNVSMDALFAITDIQYDHFGSYDQNSMQVETGKANAVYALLGVSGAGRATNAALNSMSGGAKASVQAAQNNSSQQNIDKALSDMANALKKIKDALNAVPIISDLSSTDTASLSNQKGYINAEIIAIAGKQQAISVQKTTNQSSIAAAEAAVNTAQNTLNSAQAALNLKKAGSSHEEIAAQEAQVRQAVGNLRNIQSQFTKTVILSPVAGIITKQDAKVGQMSSPGQTVISIISDAKFEIEANIPEADIAKVKSGNSAKVTLDAYGTDIIFPAKAISIDPAETVIEGVATYKTKFQFDSEDERIKSGMTANIDILTDKHDDVLVIPQRAVITKNGDKTVLLDTGKPEPEEIKIETGLKGSDGNIEILSGLKEEDRVVSSGTEQ